MNTKNLFLCTFLTLTITIHPISFIKLPVNAHTLKHDQPQEIIVPHTLLRRLLAQHVRIRYENAARTLVRLQEQKREASINSRRYFTFWYSRDYWEREYSRISNKIAKCEQRIERIKNLEAAINSPTSTIVPSHMPTLRGRPDTITVRSKLSS